MNNRLIHFERIDPEYGEVGFYCGCHNLANFSQEENQEFDDLMDELFGPRMNNYRDYKFFFTRYGFRKYKKLIWYLIRATNYKTICWRVWKDNYDVAYEDKEQVALLLGAKRKKRKRNIKTAQKLSKSSLPATITRILVVD